MKAIICGGLTALMISMVHAAEDTHSASYMLPYCKLTSKQLVDSPSQSYLLGRCAGLVEGVSHIAGLLIPMRSQGDIFHPGHRPYAALTEQVTHHDRLQALPM